MTVPDPTYPRSVTPGIETQGDEPEILPPGVYIGLDWMRFTGPATMRNRLATILQDLAKAKPEPSSGAKYFKHGQAWKPGILLSWGHKADVCMVDVQGGRLRLMDGSDRVALMHQLMAQGLRPTRIDGAIDFVDQGFNVCLHAEESCSRGELCRARRWSPNNEYRANGVPTRLLLKLGSRTSPVCGRIYDKGLEQRAAPRGYWERFEIEWKDDRAIAVTQELCQEGNGWPAKLASMIFGAIDFRESNGRSELHRRSRVAWWDRVIGGSDTVKVPPALKTRTLQRWMDGLRLSYGRGLLEFAQAVDRPVGEVVEWALRGVQPREIRSPMVAEFVRIFPKQRRK